MSTGHGAVADVRRTQDMREINNQSGTDDKNLPKYSTGDETIGGESVCGRIEGRSPSCTRSGHELQKHIRRTPYHQKNNKGTGAGRISERAVHMRVPVYSSICNPKKERPNSGVGAGYYSP